MSRAKQEKVAAQRNLTGFSLTGKRKFRIIYWSYPEYRRRAALRGRDISKVGETQNLRVWRSLVSRLVRVQEAVGSNPATRTKKGLTQKRQAFFASKELRNPRPLEAAQAAVISAVWHCQRLRGNAVGSNPATRTKIPQSLMALGDFVFCGVWQTCERNFR